MIEDRNWLLSGPGLAFLTLMAMVGGGVIGGSIWAGKQSSAIDNLSKDIAASWVRMGQDEQQMRLDETASNAMANGEAVIATKLDEQKERLDEIVKLLGQGNENTRRGR